MAKFDEVVKSIKPIDEEAKKTAEIYIDDLAKPIGALGRLEEIAAQIAGITGKTKNNFYKRCVVIMSADNGIMEENVSCAPPIVTQTQTINFFRNICGINVLSNQAGSDIRVVDIGINGDIAVEGLIKEKIRYGTANFSKEPAMTRDEAIRAMEVGMNMVEQLKSEGYDMLGTGEMGIGNTSSSAAVLIGLTGLATEKAVGKGAGLTEEDYNRKKNAIEKGLSVNKPDSSDPIDVLHKVGGLDIAGLVGMYLGAAANRVPIVMDGFISAAAALVAVKINPDVKGYIIPSHYSAEPGYSAMIAEIGLNPILKLDMRLGEGTGCPIAFSVIDFALAMVNNMGTFADAGVDPSEFVDIRE